jgi:hypothetical protein
LGLAAGPRGLELAVFRARGFYGPYEKITSLTKADLSAAGRRVLSIEGSSVLVHPDGIELFVSSEKDGLYPPEVREYQKPGTGVWSVDVLRAQSLAVLDVCQMAAALGSTAPETLHAKDPVVFAHPGGGTAMLYCTHPFSWASSNTSLAIRPSEGEAFTTVDDHVLGRGMVWDVAAARVTARLPVPPVGPFKDISPVSLYFYDGAECMRQHAGHVRAVKRPKGYSCEEIGGLAWGYDAAFPVMERLSVERPLFVSPYGTGCSRYVSILVAADAVYASWQQSSPDLSQPLVGHWLGMEAVERVLAKGEEE